MQQAWAGQVEALARQAARAALADRPEARVEVQAGKLDPRLQLAPCAQVDFYLPAGHRAWGATRVGVRCVHGPVRWNVSMPLMVRVHAPAMQLAQALPAGTTLGPEHLQRAEADWTAVDSPAFAQGEPLAGRVLARALPAGATVREVDLKRRQWFAVGDTVRVIAVGAGFSVSAEGVALTPGLEGQQARVRTEGGRTVTGIATADRRVEVAL